MRMGRGSEVTCSPQWLPIPPQQPGTTWLWQAFWASLHSGFQAACTACPSGAKAQEAPLG